MSLQQPYRGRFAPSPTGPLHFGSLIAATGSYLQAKHQRGEWLIRIDDIDPPREQKGATTDILNTLEAFGFEWDASILYQSSRRERYQEAVDQLIKQKKAYPCSCSRKSIIEKTGQTKGEIIYPGYCRNGMQVEHENITNYSIRLRCHEKPICFEDALQGPQSVNLEQDVGDYILQRRDHFFAYHLASGIDDVEQNITEVVRGADLLGCTPCQLYVQQALNLASPEYCHLPIVVDETGQKLSKQSHAKAIKPKDSVYLLYKTLKFLGQMPSIELIESSQEDIWCWAKEHWRLDLVPKKLQLTTNWDQE